MDFHGNAPPVPFQLFAPNSLLGHPTANRRLFGPNLSPDQVGTAPDRRMVRRQPARNLILAIGCVNELTGSNIREIWEFRLEQGSLRNSLAQGVSSNPGPAPVKLFEMTVGN